MVYRGELDGVPCPPQGELVVLSDQEIDEPTPSYSTKELGSAARRFRELQKLPGTQNIEDTHDKDGNRTAILERPMTREELGI